MPATRRVPKYRHNKTTDRAVVTRQLGRTPRAFRRVVVRCPFGRPAVTEQEAYDGDERPFPTTYYLTCRHLVAAVSRVEADGGVERWSEIVAHDPGLSDLAYSLSDGEIEHMPTCAVAEFRFDAETWREAVESEPVDSRFDTPR